MRSINPKIAIFLSLAVNSFLENIPLKHLQLQQLIKGDISPSRMKFFKIHCIIYFFKTNINKKAKKKPSFLIEMRGFKDS
jgi:hypothetical protein